MFLRALILISLLFTGVVNSQTNKSTMNYYDAGVEAFGKMQYKRADSMFSQAILITPTADAYFNRAACRKKTGNMPGFCQDIGAAIRQGDKEASGLFCKYCGNTDTSYITSLGNPATKNNFYYRSIKYKHANTDSFSMYFDWQGVMHPNLAFPEKTNEVSYTPKAADVTICLKPEKNAEFPGGLGNLMNFFKSNFILPKSVTDAGLVGKVYLQFIVNEDGSVSNAKVLKGVPGCKECDDEALRVVNLMPKWSPAIMSGKAVKCCLNLPINIKPPTNK